MTTCAECLATMSTSRVSDLAPGSAVALHWATCPNCSQVAEEVRYAEHRLATALNEQRSRMDSTEVTVAAMKGSERLRRARVARWIQIALIVAGCYVFYVFMEQRTNSTSSDMVKAAATNTELDHGDVIVTRTIPLKCITPEQATSLATPYLRSKAAIYPVPGISAITVRGRQEEFQRALSAIDQFDAACQLPHATTTTPTTSRATPGKD